MSSTDTIPERGENQLNDADWFNVVKRALSGDFLPRNSGGVITDAGGSLGTDSFPWLKMNIVTGHFSAGMVKVIHPYNGDAKPGQGWMLMDGRLVNSTNYDAEHGTGAWATYVGTSPINGLHLPDMRGRYGAGAATTAADGSSAIPTVGVAGNVANLYHVHQWLKNNGTGTSDDTWLSGIQNAFILTGLTKTGNAVGQGVANGARSWNDSYTDPQLSNSQDIRPDSYEACFYLRVV